MQNLKKTEIAFDFMLEHLSDEELSLLGTMINTEITFRLCILKTDIEDPTDSNDPTQREEILDYHSEEARKQREMEEDEPINTGML